MSGGVEIRSGGVKACRSEGVDTITFEETGVIETVVKSKLTNQNVA